MTRRRPTPFVRDTMSRKRNGKFYKKYFIVVKPRDVVCKLSYVEFTFWREAGE